MAPVVLACSIPTIACYNWIRTSGPRCFASDNPSNPAAVTTPWGFTSSYPDHCNGRWRLSYNLKNLVHWDGWPWRGSYPPTGPHSDPDFNFGDPDFSFGEVTGSEMIAARRFNVLAEMLDWIASWRRVMGSFGAAHPACCWARSACNFSAKLRWPGSGYPGCRTSGSISRRNH